MTRLIPHHELAIGSDQIIDPDQAVYDLRQAFNYPYDLQGFDDFLNAFGINHSNYMRAANQQKLIDAVSRGDWVMVRPKAVKDSGGASWNSFNPKPEPAPAQHLVEEHAFTVPKPVESGFHIVQQAMSLDALERALIFAELFLVHQPRTVYTQRHGPRGSPKTETRARLIDSKNTSPLEQGRSTHAVTGIRDKYCGCGACGEVYADRGIHRYWSGDRCIGHAYQRGLPFRHGSRMSKG